MNIRYDSEADAAYIMLVDQLSDGEAAKQVGFIETPNGESQVVLDFDDAGRLVGVEVLGASLALRPETLAQAD